MSIRHFLGAVILLGGAWAVGRFSSPSHSALPGLIPPASAAEILGGVSEGEVFISTDGGSAYLWRRVADRIELIGVSSRIEKGPEGQASYVWLPGVERRS
jgi:hypothetical protein